MTITLTQLRAAIDLCYQDRGPEKFYIYEDQVPYFVTDYGLPPQYAVLKRQRIPYDSTEDSTEAA
jgi:hypothetical protein